MFKLPKNRRIGDYPLKAALRAILPAKGAIGGSGGFTLIETIAILIILGVLTMVVMGHASTSVLDGQVEVVKSDLRFAQMAAMKDTVPWGISFSTDSYTLIDNGAASTCDLPGDNSSTHTLPSGVTIVSTVNPVTFDQWGSPGSSSITVTLTQGSDTASFSITQNTGLIQ